MRDVLPLCKRTKGIVQPSNGGNNKVVGTVNPVTLAPRIHRPPFIIMSDAREKEREPMHLVRCIV